MVFRKHEAGVAVFEHGEKIGVGGVHADGYAADGDDHAAALDLCGYIYHANHGVAKLMIAPFQKLLSG